MNKIFNYTKPFAIITLLGVSVFSLTCNEKENKITINEIQALSKLATVEYTLTKIIKSEESNFWGEKRILFEILSTVKAGIDFQKINEKSITITEKSITIKIPRPEILYINIKPRDVKEVYNEHGPIRRKFSEKEKDEIISVAEKRIKKAIGKTDIVSTAGKNARVFMEKLISRIYPGKKIQIEYSKKK